MKDRDYADLELFRPYRDRMRKKLALGVVSHRSLQVETPEEVADDIRYALSHIDADKLVLTSDCGFGRGGPNRLVAFYKATAIAQGANIVRRELGCTRRRCARPTRRRRSTSRGARRRAAEPLAARRSCSDSLDSDRPALERSSDQFVYQSRSVRL